MQTHAVTEASEGVGGNGCYPVAMEINEGRRLWNIAQYITKVIKVTVAAGEFAILEGPDCNAVGEAGQ